MAKIAVLIGPLFEDVEYTDPVEALREAGHDIVHVGEKREAVEGKHGTSVVIDKVIEEVSPNDFDALFIPGGFSPDTLRANKKVVDFVADFSETDKPLFAICHGPQLLIAARQLDGRTLTAWKTVQDDLLFTEAMVLDEAVVEDGNLITSRGPDDIPAFNKAVLRKLGEATA